MFPTKFIKRGVKLLNLQCWLWGQDIRRPQGNLLLQAGMVRMRPPAGLNGCSQYSFDLPSGATLKLWGFGIYCGRQQGCYLNRYEFVPRSALQENCWLARSFANAARTLEMSELPNAFDWIAAYETFVLREVGPSYRLVSAASGPDGDLSPLRLSAAWAALARDLERWICICGAVRPSRGSAAGIASARQEELM